MLSAHRYSFKTPVPRRAYLYLSYQITDSPKYSLVGPLSQFDLKFGRCPRVTYVDVASSWRAKIRRSYIQKVSAVGYLDVG